MTIDVCDICSGTGPANCLREIIGSDNMKGMWRRAVIELLCGISDGITNLGGGAGVVLPQKSFAFASVPAGFTDTTLLDSTKKLTRIYVNNTTDTDIAVSLDGGATTAFTVFANSETMRDLGPYVGTAQTSVQFKYVTDPATAGTVYFDGSY